MPRKTPNLCLARLQSQLASHGIHELSGNCKAQANSAMTAGGSGFDLFKFIENPLLIGRFNTATGIPDFEEDRCRSSFHT